MKFKGKHKNWETVLSGYRFMTCVRIIDEGSLSIFLDVGEVGEIKLYSVVWRDFYAYRNALEENGCPWKYEDRNGPFGSTAILEESPWIEDLKVNNGYLDLLHPDAKHYVILTSDYVTEVISKDDPEIEPLDPLPPWMKSEQ